MSPLPRQERDSSRGETRRDPFQPIGLIVVASVACVPFAMGCDNGPPAYVVLDNDYAATSGRVVYQAFWQAVPFQTPVPPGSSSAPQSTVPASDNTAYVVLA